MAALAELDDRIAKCQKILTMDPNSQIFAALAEALRKKGELDKAFRACQSGLKIHPKYGSAHCIMAKINLDRGQYDWAETELNQARMIDGPSRATDLLLAEVSIYRGNFEDAIKLLKELQNADPGNKHIQKLLEIAQQIPQEREEKLKVEQKKTPTEKAEPSGDNGDLAVHDTISGVDSVSPTEIIIEAMAMPELIGAMFVNREGLLVESNWSAPQDKEVCAATLSEVIKYLNSELAKNSFGSVNWVLIETASQAFQLIHQSSGTFIFTGSSKLNLGAMRMKLTELLTRYWE